MQYQRQTTKDRTDQVDEQYDFVDQLEETDNFNDPNFAELKFAIADESSIKYEPEIKDGSPTIRIPSPQQGNLNKVGRRLMSDSSDDENPLTDRRDSPAFAPSRDETNQPKESPVFGKSIVSPDKILSPKGDLKF